MVAALLNPCISAECVTCGQDLVYAFHMAAVMLCHHIFKNTTKELWHVLSVI